MKESGEKPELCRNGNLLAILLIISPVYMKTINLNPEQEINMKKTIRIIATIALLLSTYTYANTNVAENCSCVGLAGNLPAITLMHSSKWGSSGLKSFLLVNDDIEEAVNKCESLKKKLIIENICSGSANYTN